MSKSINEAFDNYIHLYNAAVDSGDVIETLQAGKEILRLADEMCQDPNVSLSLKDYYQRQADEVRKRLKKIEKGGGKKPQTAAIGKGDFSATDWFSAEAPKLTLAAIVEMLGYIPDDGECGHVYKTKDGWEWQDMTEAVFDSDYNTLARREQSTLSCILLPIRFMSPLILTLARKMYRVTGPGALAADKSRFCFKEPGSLCFGDHDSELYIGCQRPELPSRVWQQLEQLDWEAGEDGSA